MKILLNEPQECTAAELEYARSMLMTFLKGVAGSLKGDEVLESFTRKELESSKNAALQRWKKLVDEVKNNPEYTIKVPTRLNAAEDVGTSLHIGKARLSLGNSLPDPWLLLVKSAINYSAFCNTKCMPACPLTNYDDEMDTNQGVELEKRIMARLVILIALTSLLMPYDAVAWLSDGVSSEEKRQVFSRCTETRFLPLALMS